jgi:acyl carrier protein phosphodiesterase
VNHLAHLLVADRRGACPLGTLMGDHVKGPLGTQLPCELRRAVALHRRVDGFTDAHPVFRRSKRLLSGDFGHYAGILVDVFYDHCLAVAWDAYCGEPLERFAVRTYGELRSKRHLAPEALRPLIDGMQRVDLLASYRHTHGVERALGSVSRRLRRPNRVHEALPALQAVAPALRRDFEEFFPELLEGMEHDPAGATARPETGQPSGWPSGCDVSI